MSTNEVSAPVSGIRFTLTLEELDEILSADHAASGGAVADDTSLLTVERYGPELVVASTEVREEHSRKGGAIAGSTLFSFFDAIGYMVTLAQSPRGTEAYTTDVSIHFLRPGPIGRYVIEARPLRFGRRASVVAVTVLSPEVPDGPIASGHITFAPVFPGA